MTPQNHSDEVGCIELTRGYYAIVDVIDADLAELKWHYRPRYSSKPDKGYATRNNERLHRVILARAIGRELQKGEECDHINGNTLDNRRENLRAATHAQNMKNAKKQRRQLYKGVTRRGEQWRARIMCNGVSRHLGYFETAKEAHEAYCRAAKELHGEFARFE